MNRTKIILFILFAITLSMIAIVMYVFFISTNNRTPANPVFTTPTPIQVNGPTQQPPTPSPLTLLRVDPPEDATGKYNYGPGKPVVFTFNKDVNLQTTYIEVSPNIKMDNKVGSSPRQIIVFPEFGWDAYILYTITIKKGSVAADGGILENDIIYQIKTTLTQGGV